MSSMISPPRWHRYFRHPSAAANAALIISSIFIDLFGLALIGAAIFGPTFAPFLAVLIVFGLRQICQGLCTLPPPPGIIWRNPGFPRCWSLTTWATISSSPATPRWRCSEPSKRPISGPPGWRHRRVHRPRRDGHRVGAAGTLHHGCHGRRPRRVPGRGGIGKVVPGSGCVVAMIPDFSSLLLL